MSRVYSVPAELKRSYATNSAGVLSAGRPRALSYRSAGRSRRFTTVESSASRHEEASLSPTRLPLRTIDADSTGDYASRGSRRSVTATGTLGYGRRRIGRRSFDISISIRREFRRDLFVASCAGTWPRLLSAVRSFRRDFGAFVSRGDFWFRGRGNWWLEIAFAKINAGWLRD